MSLRRRLALILGGVVAVFVVFSAVLSWWLAETSLRGSVDDQLREQAARFEDRLAEGSARPIPDVPPGERSRLNEAAIRLQVIGPNGEVNGSADLPLDDDVVAVVEGQRAELVRTVDIDGRPFRVLTRRSGENTVQLGTDIESIESGLVALQRALLVTGLTGVLVAAGLGWFVARGFTKPIVDVTAAAGQLAAQRQFPGPIEVVRRDEVGQLAKSFNELVAALALSRDQQARLVADAGHELRTPLTSLRMKIDFLQSEPDLPLEQRQRVIEGSAAELESLAALTNELLELAASRSTEEEAEVIDLGLVVTEAASRARLSTHRPVEVSISGTRVPARPAMVRRALASLIDNAHKYSPPDSPIEIREFDGGIEVRDHGPGIAPEDRPFVFDRFYRSSGAQTLPGSGIGLALVKQVAMAHDGRVWIDAAAGGGAVVGFSLGPVSS